MDEVWKIKTGLNFFYSDELKYFFENTFPVFIIWTDSRQFKNEAAPTYGIWPKTENCRLANDKLHCWEIQN